MGNDPASKQRALASLARQADRHRPAQPVQYLDTRPASAPVDSGVREFAQAVTASMEGPILRFSRRQQLIEQAEQLGIRRFDANLLIAAVQHRFAGEAACAIPDAPSNGFNYRTALVIALILQFLILLGAWAVFHS
jgi:hypothetical protein